ncbi:vegetative incompatibility protein HET-E-1-like [Hibiscus syriacus]|uniref:Vegetative incompatibility protein HET-E-1-like n=1 Tax=Hibiscus syriacus TaxID=106335 RepID=A0A6A3D117_HIBSY|nr:vegetative incompatibility protein HET-E-1-like [Hibiscus syriacus]
MDELHCNIVVMKGSQAKVLRLNLQCIDELRTLYVSAASSPVMDSGGHLGHRVKHSTPVSSPEEPSTSYSRKSQEGYLPNSDSSTSYSLFCQENPLFEVLNLGNYSFVDNKNNLDNQLALIDSHGEKLINLSVNSTSSVKSNDKSVFWIPQNHNDEKPGKTLSNRAIPPSSKTLLDKFVQLDRDAKEGRLVNQSHDKYYMVSSDIRDAVSLGRTSSIPPPLCSFCQHKAPVFGIPPRRFSFEELEEATDGFAEVNFLAECDFGIVIEGFERWNQQSLSRLAITTKNSYRSSMRLLILASQDGILINGSKTKIELLELQAKSRTTLISSRPWDVPLSCA